MGKLTSVCVEYKYVNDWHIFQSEDIHGLYVAHKDAKIAYDDVKTAIEKLILLNENVKCTVQPEMDFYEFIESMKPSKVANKKSTIQSPVMSNKRYTVLAAAA